MGILAPVLIQAEVKPTEAPVEAIPPQPTGTVEEFAAQIVAGVEAEKAGKLDKAVEAYTKAISYQADAPVALVRRAVVYSRLGKKNEAMLDLRRATSPRTRPKTVTDFATLGWLRATCPLAEFRDGSLAVTYGTKAVTFAESAEHYDVLAAGYAEMGNFQRARDSILRGFKLAPDDARLKGMQERLKLYNDRKKYRDDWWPDKDDR